MREVVNDSCRLCLVQTGTDLGLEKTQPVASITNTDFENLSSLDNKTVS